MPRIMTMTEKAGEGAKIQDNLTSHRAGGRRLARARIADGPRRMGNKGLDLGRGIINRPKKGKRIHGLATMMRK